MIAPGLAPRMVLAHGAAGGASLLQSGEPLGKLRGRVCRWPAQSAGGAGRRDLPPGLPAAQPGRQGPRLGRPLPGCREVVRRTETRRRPKIPAHDFPRQAARRRAPKRLAAVRRPRPGTDQFPAAAEGRRQPHLRLLRAHRRCHRRPGHRLQAADRLLRRPPRRRPARATDGAHAPQRAARARRSSMPSAATSAPPPSSTPARPSSATAPTPSRCRRSWASIRWNLICGTRARAPSCCAAPATRAAPTCRASGWPVWKASPSSTSTSRGWPRDRGT